MSLPPSKPRDYHVGWICAVQTEYVVACELLDEEYPTLPASSPHDNNTYTFGRISHHNVVIACLPKGKYGLTSAASVAKDILRSFPSIRVGLMVGIGGGAPSLKHDIRLGDVVVSSPVGSVGGVIHYEFGKTIQKQRFERTGTLDAPPPMLLTALSVVGALHERKGHRIAKSVSEMIGRNPRLRKKYQRPELGTDRLYESNFIHPDRDQACEKVCSVETAQLIQRNERTADEDDPMIHYGIIASADRLMKDAQVRDTLARNEEVLCFEMEAAGLMDNFPCVVIRGICDYSDTHKNDIWQGYAAATAAAYAKELLEVIPATELSWVPTTHEGRTKTIKLQDAGGTCQRDYGRSNRIKAPVAPARTNGRQQQDSIKRTQFFPTRSRILKSIAVTDCRWLPQTIHVPLDRNFQFTGRDDDLRKLDQLFAKAGSNEHTAEMTIRIVAVHGLGGVGKTQLVNQYVHQTHATSKTSVFWFTADSIGQLDSQYKDQAELLRNTTATDTNPLLINLVKEYQLPRPGKQLVLEWISLHEDYILVLDNFDDITMDIRSFLPHKAPGRILFTSRDRNVVGRYAHLGLPLTRPSLLDSERLFLRLRGTHESTADNPEVHPEYQDIIQIVEELDGFPLALSQAAAFIRQNRPMRFAEYLTLLRSGSHDREQLLRFEAANPDYPASVMTTWELSLKYLEKINREAKDLLNILGFFSPFGIYEPMLRASVRSASWQFGTFRGSRNLSPDQQQQFVFLKEAVPFATAVGSLVSLSLITRNADIASLSVHPLVHEWIKTRLNSEPQEQSRLATLCGLILYQAYPIELCAAYSCQNQSARDLLNTNLQQSNHHTQEVISNICKYSFPGLSMPLECATLIVAVLLNGLKAHVGGYRHFKDKIRIFIRQYGSTPFPVGEGLQCLQRAVCCTLQKIRINRDLDAWLELAKNIPKMLRKTYFANACKHNEIIFIVVYVSTILSLLETESHWWATVDPGYQAVLKDKLVEVKAAALLELLGCLAVVPDRQPEISMLQVCVGYRLGEMISFDNYCTKAQPLLTNLLELSIFRHVPFDFATTYLKLIISFQWRCKPQDLEAILNSILLTAQVCIAESERQEDQRWQDMSSHQTYISSSFGRYSGAQRSGQGLVAQFARGLDEIWDLVIPVVDEVLERGANPSALYDAPRLSRLYAAVRQLQKAMQAIQEGASDSPPFKSFKLVELQGRIARLLIIEGLQHSWLYASKAFYSYYDADYFLNFFSTTGPETWLSQRADVLMPNTVLPPSSLLRAAQNDAKIYLVTAVAAAIQEPGQERLTRRLNTLSKSASPPLSMSSDSASQISVEGGGKKNFSDNIKKESRGRNAFGSSEKCDAEGSTGIMGLELPTSLPPGVSLSQDRYNDISKAVETVKKKLLQQENYWAAERIRAEPRKREMRQAVERRKERREAGWIETGWEGKAPTAQDIPTAKQRIVLIKETEEHWQKFQSIFQPLEKSEVKSSGDGQDPKSLSVLQAFFPKKRLQPSEANQNQPTKKDIETLARKLKETRQLLDARQRQAEKLSADWREVINKEFNDLYLAFFPYPRDAALMLSSWVLCLEKLSAGEDDLMREILFQPEEISRLRASVTLIQETPLQFKVFRTLECLELICLLAAATDKIRSRATPECESDDPNMFEWIPEVEEASDCDEDELRQCEIECIGE